MEGLFMHNALRRPVVVGIAGSRGELAAIKLAAAEAHYREAPLIAVISYRTANPLGAPATRPLATMRTTTEEQEIAESTLRDEVNAALGPQAADAELRTMPGLTGRTLVETAQDADAQLIVLATGRSTSMLAGTVSNYVLRNAPCPVLVVPDASKV
jgi:nucleotide-binding universal stress UspA family protein